MTETVFILRERLPNGKYLADEVPASEVKEGIYIVKTNKAMQKAKANRQPIPENKPRQQKPTGARLTITSLLYGRKRVAELSKAESCVYYPDDSSVAIVTKAEATQAAAEGLQTFGIDSLKRFIKAHAVNLITGRNAASDSELVRLFAPFEI